MTQKIKKTIIIMGLLPAVLFAAPAFATTTTTSTGACDNTTTPATVNACITQSPIVKDINQIINFMSGVVGVAIVAAIVLGGIQYSAAGDNPQGVTAAKKRITNAVIALVGFMLIYAFVQWLIPGGVFNS